MQRAADRAKLRKSRFLSRRPRGLAHSGCASGTHRAASRPPACARSSGPGNRSHGRRRSGPRSARRRAASHAARMPPRWRAATATDSESIVSRRTGNVPDGSGCRCGKPSRLRRSARARAPACRRQSHPAARMRLRHRERCWRGRRSADVAQAPQRGDRTRRPRYNPAPVTAGKRVVDPECAHYWSRATTDSSAAPSARWSNATWARSTGRPRRCPTIVTFAARNSRRTSAASHPMASFT